MSSVAIRATDLKKVYRLYTKPAYRFLDMFGLLGEKPGAFTEHAALDGITLDIARGEKVAIIGRNGAGKSTFLKLVTNVIRPTSGSIEVQGDVHALLQIGTGFHPDFTGRQNVYAYLAQLGVTGGVADQKYRSIVEFAELEEYIDQPVKTYSTGMAVRLIFSAATAITPELLVLDEVLGVGDAYFAQKSFERMRELCEGAGTTLLLVTHDVYSAVKMCERLIWIDRGRVLMDGDGVTVVKAYEDSIRQQEEQRLRIKKQQRLKEMSLAEAGTERPVPTPFIIEVQSASNRPPASPVYFSRIDLIVGRLPFSLPIDEAAFDEARPNHLQREGTCWGDAVTWQGRPARALMNYGSPFHKIAGAVVSEATPSDEIGLDLEYWSDAPFSVSARAFVDERIITFGSLDGVVGHWARWSARGIAPTQGALAGEANSTGIHGTGAITLTAIHSLDGRGRETHFFAHGRPFTLTVAYRINQPELVERPQVLVAFHRDGVQDVCRAITRDLLFDGTRTRSGEVRLHVPKLGLADGTYTVTVMVAREGYYDDTQTRYFTLNEGVYACHTRAFEIVVTDGGIVGSGTGVVIEGEWTLLPTDAAVAHADQS